MNRYHYAADEFARLQQQCMQDSFRVDIIKRASRPIVGWVTKRTDIAYPFRSLDRLQKDGMGRAIGAVQGRRAAVERIQRRALAL